MYFDSGDDQPKYEILDTTWVNSNFDANILDVFKKHSVSCRHKFLRLPLGDAIDVKPTMNIDSNPIVKYQQEPVPVCAYAAIASCLFHFEYFNEAKSIMSFCYQTRDGPKTLFNSTRTMQYIMAEIYKNPIYKKLRSKYVIEKIGSDHDLFLMQSNMNNQDFKFIVLHSSDNHQSHSVCVTNQYIFDCNSKRALPMTLEGINCSCGENADFVKIQSGYNFYIRKTQTILTLANMDITNQGTIQHLYENVSSWPQYVTCYEL